MCIYLTLIKSVSLVQFGYFSFLDEVLGEETNKIDVIVEVSFNFHEEANFSIVFALSRQVCGVPSVVNDGFRLLKPGGTYIFAGMVHPHSQLNITGEQIIRKCLTIKGK